MAGYECPDCGGSKMIVKLIINCSTMKTDERREPCERCKGRGEIQIKSGIEIVPEGWA